LAVIAASALVLAAYSSGGVSGASSGSSTSKYGASAQPGGGITYQPDVVFVGGAGSIKAVSANGLQWTISGSAPNVGELKVGKILFASSLGVGRILAVKSSGSNKQLVLGPVNLTDIIRDGTIASSAPISLGSVQGYAVANQPGLLTGATTSADIAQAPVNGDPGPAPHTVTTPAVHFVADVAGQKPTQANPGLSLSPTPSAPSSSTVGSYHLTPFCCSGGVGVHVGYNNNGLKMSATVTLHLTKPSVGFNLKIASGKLVNAAIELHGAGGFGIAVTATSTTGNAGDVKNQHVEIPVDFSVPITGFGIPLTVGFDQVFGLSAAFTAHPSAFTATGKYDFGGSLGFGLHNGSASVYSPQDFTVATNPATTMNLVSVGPAAVLVNYQAKMSVGVGFLGFRTGVWFALAFNTGLTESGATSAACRSSAFAMFDEYGVGYSIPKSTVALVNKFLQVFHGPPIQATGGFSSSPATLIKRTSVMPPTAVCA
jgi:hypothetical protein